MPTKLSLINLPGMINEAELRQNLIADNNFFKNVLDLIPPHFYFDHKSNVSNEDDTEEAEGITSEPKAKKRGAEKQLTQRAQWKIAKYDPAQIKTVSQRMEMEDEDDSEGQVTLSNKARKKKVKQKLESKSSADSLEELQERLRAKLDGLRAKRNALGKDDVLEKKKMKRRESKLLLKAKRKMEKQKTNIHVKDSGTREGTNIKSPPSAKPIYNKDGKMVFSKFDFTEKVDKHKEGQTSNKNYTKLLEKAKREKERVEKMKELNPEKAKIVTEKKLWKSALDKAEGVKVRDDIDLLKKAQKRKDKIKKKHQKDWKDREAKVEKRKQDKQDKRTKNIQKRKQAKVDKKIKKSKKKGHIIPGF